MPKYVLSLDGGGIRGIISAVILAEIENRTEKPISKIFDLMAGTSTGALAASALCLKNENGKPKYTANELIDLYRKHGEYIFKSSFCRHSVLSWLNSTQYPHEHIEHVLDKYFGDYTVKDTLSHLLITSYDIHNNMPLMFKSWREDRNFVKLKDAIRASTAAPTYFIPKRMKINEQERVLVDGGVFANNPAACAFASAKVLFPNDEIILLSIGTGRSDRSFEFNNIRRFGKIDWIQPLLEVMFCSSLDAVDYQLKRALPNRYTRIQSKLNKTIDLDKASSKNIESLTKEANETIKKFRVDIDNFCSAVT